jgi:uncharacterized protein (TIGR02145 family)
MKITTISLVLLLIVINGNAQNKSLTLHYPNDSTNVLDISGLDSMTIFICGVSKVYYEGQAYNTVQIGDQCWLNENLNVGTRINISQNSSDNGVIEKSCYGDNEDNCDEYGGLYSWDEAMQYDTTNGSRGICPEGWHIPTIAELTVLKNTVSGSGNALKEIGQGFGAGAGTNTSGFSALLAGYRHFTSYYGELNVNGHIWSSTLDDFNRIIATHMYLNSTTDDIIFHIGQWSGYGFCIRCIKD